MHHLSLSACFIDLQRGLVQRDGQTLRLTPVERGLLGALAARPGEVVSRAQLLAQAWGLPDDPATRRVDNAVRRLRVKIEAAPSAPVHLRKVYGEGYVLDLVGAEAPSTPGFFGRVAERAWLERALADGAPLITLLGPPGAGRRALKALVSRGRACPALRVADAPTGAPGERVLALGGLTPAEAERLVAWQAGAVDPGWRPLIEAVDALPLPLTELCARARLLTPSELAARLAEDPERLLPQTALRTQRRWARLEPALQRDLVALASFARAEVPVADAEALLGEGALIRLEALVLRGLVLRASGPPSALRAPLLLRRRAAAQVGEAARRRHGAWCVAQIEALHAQYGGPEGERAVDDALALLPELRLAYARALPASPVLAARLALGVNTALRRRGRLDVIEDLEALAAPQLPALPPLWRARWLQLRSERRRVSGELVGAAEDAERALLDAELSGDRVERGMATGQRAVVAHTSGDRAAAERDYRAAAQLLEEGPARSRASWLSNLGGLLARRGADEEAEATLLELIALWLQEGDARMEARARGELGRALVERGLAGRAEVQLLRALQVWQALADPQALAVTQLRLGLLRLEQARLAEAREALARAREAARRLGEPRTQAQALGYTGIAWLLEGRREEARQALGACVQLHQAEVGAGLEVNALGWLVALESAAGRMEEAGACARAARAIEDPLGALLRVQLCWPALARRERPQASAEAWRRAKAVLREVEAEAARDLELRLACRHLGARLGLR